MREIAVCIYYVDSTSDVTERQLYRYDIDNNVFYSADVKNYDGNSPAFFFPIKGENHRFLCGLNLSVYIVKWEINRFK